SGTDVYVAGDVFPAKHDVAVYWKNGVEHALKNNSPDTYGQGIAVDANNNVYVAGSALSTKNNTYAAMWKNGTYTSIADTVNGSDAIAVTTSGSDVYIAGYNSVHPVYWKNGVVNALSGPATYARDVTISNGDIYVLGMGGLSAMYWKNGTLVTVTDKYMTEGDAFAVQVSDVFIAGIEYTNNLLPVYWKNNTIVHIPGKGGVGGLQNIITGIAVVTHPH
ncbi:MAG: SBBP repeat-containing protein, partial [Mucilaginibacter sp.]